WGVTLLRSLHDVPAVVYLHDARVLLVPSVTAEGWGRVVREAQASGIPVVATGVGGLPEAVGSGGIVVPPAAGFEGLLRALAMLWDDREAYAVAAERSEHQGADPATSSNTVAPAFERLLAG